MKIVKTEEGISYEINEPMAKAEAVKGAIIAAMTKENVQPEEVLPVLGEAVIEFLVIIAKVTEVDELSLIKCFGEGIYTAQVELKNSEDDED